jgi:hypothetical protein
MTIHGISLHRLLLAALASTATISAADIVEVNRGASQLARISGAQRTDAVGPAPGRLPARLDADRRYFVRQLDLWTGSAKAIEGLNQGLIGIRETPQAIPLDAELRQRRADVARRIEELLPRTETHGRRIPDPADVRELKRLTTLASILDREIEAGEAMLKTERGERGQIERLERDAREAAQLAAERRRRLEWGCAVDAEAMRLLTVPTQRRIGSGRVWSVVFTVAIVGAAVGLHAANPPKIR